MVNKTIAEFNAAGTISGTDLIAGYQTDSVKYDFGGTLVYYNANTQLASSVQVSNLYGGAPLQISSNTTLTYPLPSVIIANTSGGSIQLHFPNFDATKCQLGQQIIVVNIGSGSLQNVTPYNGSGSQFGGPINGGYVCLIQISAIGTGGVGDAILQTIMYNENLNLDGIIGVASNGLYARTGSATAAARTITAGSSLISITDGDGVSGNPTIDVNESSILIAENQVINLVSDLASLNSNKQNASDNLSSLSVIPAADNGIVVKTNGLGTVWATRSLTSSDSSLTITNPDGVSANPDLTLASTVTPVGKHNLMISLGSMYPALSNGVTIAQVQSATNLNNFRGWSFPNGVNCYAHMQVAMPKSWNGGDLSVRLFLVTSSTTTTAGITFDIQAINRNNGDAFDIAFPSVTIIPTVNPGSTAYNLLISQDTTFTPGGNAFSFPSMVEFRIQRNPLDTVAAPVILVGVLISLTTNAGNDA